jgi:putative restriction endonuclease
MQPAGQCEKWLTIAANLRVDRKHNIAPHKPLLLLVVAELGEQGKLEPILPLTGELVFRFLVFWTVVANRRPQKPNIRLPFYHMHSDGCWTPLSENGEPTFERMRVAAARFDETFLACLHDPSFRKQLRRVLIARYFTDPSERTALYDLVALPVPPDDVVKADAKLYEESRERGREARFRLTVVPAYNYTCALTGYRLVTVDAGSIVDAAHIHQFADSQNNHPQNGLALCKNAHWMFDAGLWSLDNDFRVVVAKNRFHEAGDAAFLLKRKAGQRVHLPDTHDYWPDKAHLAWHREHKFSAGASVRLPALAANVMPLQTELATNPFVR